VRNIQSKREGCSAPAHKEVDRRRLPGGVRPYPSVASGATRLSAYRIRRPDSVHSSALRNQRLSHQRQECTRKIETFLGSDGTWVRYLVVRTDVVDLL